MSALEWLAAIEARDLNLCGSCDGGLPMGCTCGDPRPSLMATVTALRAALAIDPWPNHSATMQGYELDEAHGYNQCRTEMHAAINAALDVTP
jgi:hypothetical protein